MRGGDIAVLLSLCNTVYKSVSEKWHRCTFIGTLSHCVSLCSTVYKCVSSEWHGCTFIGTLSHSVSLCITMYKCVSEKWHGCTFIGWYHCPHRGYLRISPHTSKAHCTATCLIMMRRMTTTKIMVMMTITMIPRQVLCLTSEVLKGWVG